MHQHIAQPPRVLTSAVKLSIGFTIGFHNHGEGPCDCETDGSFYSTSFNQEFYLKATCCCIPKIAFKSDRSI